MNVERTFVRRSLTSAPLLISKSITGRLPLRMANVRAPISRSSCRVEEKEERISIKEVERDEENEGEGAERDEERGGEVGGEGG
jgi:hypothetical protein